MILTYPDTPVNVVEIIADRTPTTISIEWNEGPENGGTPVLDYRVSYDQATGEYVVLASMINALKIQASALTTGLTYKFKVEARNSYGFSAYTSEVAILCAAEPSQPDAPVTQVVNDEVIVEWTAPSDNGTPITYYELEFK